jgi:hypothetical protein
MPAEHPAESQREWMLGIVTRVHAATWEVDATLAFGTSGIVRRCKIVGPFLPEVHTDSRQSKVLVGRLDAFQQAPVAVPIHNVIVPDDQKASYVYWSEHLAWRIRISRGGVLELENTTTGQRLRGEQDGPFWRLTTPACSVLLDDGGNLVQLDAENIHLGAGAIERLVLGEQIMAYINILVGIFNEHVHVPGGNPPTTEQPIFPESALSPVSKTL